MLSRSIRYRRILVPGVLLVILSLWLSSGFALHPTKAAGPTSLVYDWGRGDSGQLGNGTTPANTNVPVMSNLPSGISPTAIAAGAFYGMASGNDGKLYAWGNNQYGQLGNGSTTNSAIPVVVNLPAGVTPITIATGDNHSLAIGNDGKLYAWGLNSSGQLGNGSTTNSANPVTVILPAGVTPTAIDAGDNHSLATGSDGKLYAWGSNSFGQLGNGTTSNSATPVVVNLPAGVTPTIIVAAGEYSFAVGNNGKLYAWGRNSTGQLGNGTANNNPTTTPFVVTLPAGVIPTAIDAGGNHTIAIANDGKLYTWGANDYGQLGNGNSIQSNIPITATLPAGVTPVAIAAGGEFTFMLGSDGNLYDCGRNDVGQLGNGSYTSQSTLGIVTFGNGLTPDALAGGDFLSMAIFPLPDLSINNVSQAEGNSGTTNFTFTVTLSTASSQTVTVDYTTTDGTATTPGDYTTTTGTLTFSPGITTQTITVPVIGDIQIEPDETFTVNLSNPANATISAAQGTGTIINDDMPPTLMINNVSQVEGNTGTASFVFTATLSYASVQTVTVPYNTTDGTATASSDYTTTSGTLTFAPGTTTQTITVLVNGDTVVEPDETFTVDLGKPVNANLTTAQATGTIINDDSPPTISINNVSQTEGNSGTANFGFTVNLSYAAPQTVTVAYTTADGTATAGSDYVATSGTLTFLPGSSSQPVNVVVKGDTAVEPDETFTVNLSTPTNATIAAGQGTGTIVNDDVAPGTSVTTLTSNPNPSMVGQAVTFEVNVIPTGATGTITLTEGTTVLGTATFSGSAVDFVLSDLLVGSHTVVAQYSGDATHTGSTSNTVIQVVNAIAPPTTPTPTPPPTPPPTPVGHKYLNPADLIAELRVSPDREFGLEGDGDNTLVYTLTVKNVGPGKANNVSVRFPIDPELEAGYVVGDTSEVWVQQIVTNTAIPYILISIPPMENSITHTVQVVMRAGANATAGSSLLTSYKVYWDDGKASHRSQQSNGVRLALTDGTTNRNDTSGAVQFYSLRVNNDTKTVTLAGDFYQPGEWLDVWYTNASNLSKSLPQVQADPAGKLSMTVDVSDWAVGHYVIAGRGVRTEITGAIAIDITEDTSSATHAKTISATELNETSLTTYLTQWSSAK